MTKKVYLGDSVYAKFRDYGELILTTENDLPDDPSNSIILEHSIIRSLCDFLGLDWRTSEILNPTPK